MKQTFLCFIICLLIFNLYGQDYSKEKQLDINNSTLEEIQRLPVSAIIAERIYERILYKGDLTSIYQLKEIEGIDQNLLNKLKPLVRIEPFKPKSSWEEKVEEIYYQLDRWAGNEGINDTFIDLWIDKALDPINVNKAGYEDLINLQNVSPVDAVAILNYRNDLGQIGNSRELRSVPGLSYYGYRSARRFLDYEDANPSETVGLHGHLKTRIDNTPFFSDEDAASTEASLSSAATQNNFGVNGLPNFYYKMRFNFNRNFKFGYTYTRRLSEPNYYYNDKILRIPKGKFYLGIEDFTFGDFKLKKLYLGNYSASIGQGVIMENTDFFVPRKGGYGFRKRFTGISGDNSQTREFALKGAATELEYNNFNAIIFGSFTSRDAILNTKIYDEKRGRGFNRLIILDQRFNYSLDDVRRGPDSLNLSWRNSVRELTYGGNIQYTFFPGTYLGLTYYESAYDRPIEPIVDEIVVPANMRRLVTADTEVLNAYGLNTPNGTNIGQGTNPFWDAAVSFRRVYGFNFQTVIENVAIQGEWGELDKGGSVFKLGDDPKALVLSLYTQYNSFNVMALYRNYDIGYDNPFQRSFSNYRRFKGTIYEDYYYLQSSLYGQLYENSAQPQSEEGIYLSTYYQVNRNITTQIQYDNWVRKADQAKQYRLVGTLNYRPVFPLRIQLRQKWQAREGQNDITLLYFENLAFRGRMDLRLSGYDNLSILYVTGKTLVHPRPRVFGDMSLDGEAIAGMMTHNFNKYLKISGMLAYYKGFFWNFEDTQFVVLDSQRGAIRSWWTLYARLNNNFSVRMKYTLDHQKSVNNIIYTDVRDPEPGLAYSADFQRSSNSFFYVEFNYNF